MTARTAVMWLVVLTLLLVGVTLAVDALQPRLAPRPAPVRATPPAGDSPVLVATVRGLSLAAGHATIPVQHLLKPSNARGAWRAASSPTTCRFPGPRSSPS